MFAVNVTGSLNLPSGNGAGASAASESPRLAGYRIHMGVTHGPALARPATTLDGAPEGALSADDQILATYCHGLFDSPDALNALLAWAGHKAEARFDPVARREHDLDRLADAVEQHMDLARLAECVPFFAQAVVK